MPRTLKELAQEAIDVQNASNLTAVVRTFASALDDLWQYAVVGGHGTEWVNRHPVTRAYVSKLTSLSSHEASDSTFSEVMRLSAELRA